MTSDGTNSYSWDNANRLLIFNSTDFQYAYNGFGQRVKQTVSGTATQYLIDQQPGLWQTLAATTGMDIVRYLQGPTGFESQQNKDGLWVQPVKDGLGSVRGVVN